jgi:hypothetical protein
MFTDQQKKSVRSMTALIQGLKGLVPDIAAHPVEPVA